MAEISLRSYFYIHNWAGWVLLQVERLVFDLDTLFEFLLLPTVWDRHSLQQPSVLSKGMLHALFNLRPFINFHLTLILHFLHFS